ncbi:MAG: hypothetical protein H6718_36810 [Polyangiaceae bacterium]|nr:hypothetical protein [Myxococcales bacterium]MCB9591025.1 hypothetical protein [Polyangiaceae bacterium]MCB9605188.1 hypothetical protein [Polyangiaceae bacterium]
MLSAALACVLATACIWAAVARNRKLNAVADGREFRDRLGHASVPRLAQLRDQVASGPGRDLLDAVLDARTPRQAVVEVNVVVGDLKYELRGAHEVAKSASRIALAGGGMLAVVQLIQFLRGGGTPTTALICLCAGVTGGLVCTGLAKSAQTRARAQLEAWGHVTRRLAEVSRQRFDHEGLE